jgi:hypothetical protein
MSFVCLVNIHQRFQHFQIWHGADRKEQKQPNKQKEERGEERKKRERETVWGPILGNFNSVVQQTHTHTHTHTMSTENDYMHLTRAAKVNKKREHQDLLVLIFSVKCHMLHTW